MLKHPTPKELEHQADLLLLRNGFDKNGKRIPKRKHYSLFPPIPSNEVKKPETPAVG